MTAATIPVPDVAADRWPVLTVSSHPVQIAGTWAITLLAGKDHPSEVHEDDFDRALDQLVGLLCEVSDVPTKKDTERPYKEAKERLKDAKKALKEARQAAEADPEDDALHDAVAVAEKAVADADAAVPDAKPVADHQWLWTLYNSHFPNSKVTHSKRFGWDDKHDRVRAQVIDLEGLTSAPEGLGCTWCANDADVLVTKATWPMGTSDKYAGWGPQDVFGTASCGVCARVVWAAPLVAATNGYWSTVIWSPTDESLTRRIAEQNLRLTRQAMRSGASALPYRRGDNGAAAVVKFLLSRVGVRSVDSDVSVFTYHPDNQDAAVDLLGGFERAVCRWVSELSGDLLVAFRRVVAASARTYKRGKSDQSHISGAETVGKALMGEPTEFVRLCLRLTTRSWEEFLDPSDSDDARLGTSDTRLVQLLTSDYLESMMSMTRSDLDAVDAVADRIVEHLLRKSTQDDFVRGPAQGFRRASNSRRDLRDWITQESWEWTLNRDGADISPLVTVDEHRVLFDGANSADARALLTTYVINGLHHQLVEREIAPVLDPNDDPVSTDTAA